MTQQANPMELAWRIADGQFNESVQLALQRGFSAFVDAGGAVPLERCLRLPRSAAGFRLTQRDRWLVEVARSTEGKTAWARCVAVSQALDVFLSRGSWHAWRDLQDAPPGTSNLRRGAVLHREVQRRQGPFTKTGSLASRWTPIPVGVSTVQVHHRSTPCGGTTTRKP